MNKFIQLTRHLYEEPYQLNLVVIACSGSAVGSLEFYTNADRLRETGEALSVFPRHDRDTFFCQRGYEEHIRPFGSYLMLHAVALRNTEQCALRLRLNNNGNRPEKSIHLPQLDVQVTDFWLRATRQRIKELGELLVEFSKLEHQRLYWDGSRSLIDNELQFRERRTGDNPAAAFASLPSDTFACS